MEHKDRILIVDDDPDIRQLLVDYLQRNGFEALPAASGREMAVMLEHHAIDLLVLDLMLPDADGLTLCRDLRARSSLPVLMLTARGEDLDRIVGLEVGADDYVAKPCNPREIVARLRAILRRTQAAAGDERADDAPLRIADIELRPTEHRVLCAGTDLGLTSAEYATLEVLLRHAGQVVRKPALMQAAFGRRLGPYDRSLDMHISRLRRKLGPDGRGAERIKTVRGVGYLYVRDQVDCA